MQRVCCIINILISEVQRCFCNAGVNLTYSSNAKQNNMWLHTHKHGQSKRTWGYVERRTGNSMLTRETSLFEKLPVNCAICSLLDVGWLLVLVLVARVQMRANVNGPPLAWFEWPQTNWSNYNSAANMKLGHCSSKYESSLFSPRRRDQLTSADVLHNCVENLPIHIMTRAVWSSCWECIRVKNGRCCVNFTRKQGLWCTAVQHVALMFQI